jgi:membrane-associated phospholipid phosphatase
MRAAEIVNLVYFAGLAILALVLPLPRGSRLKAVLIGSTGFAITDLLPYTSRVVRDWVPVPVMALAYWQSGCFFQKPSSKWQAIFEKSELRLLRMFHVNFEAWRGSWIAAFLELMYSLCYPVVPLGLAALYTAGFKAYADDYWTVVLLSAYPCYAVLPFMQLLPPRRVNSREPRYKTNHLRSFNLWLVRHVTHEANTFPSGHVAASAAIALVLFWFTPPAGILFSLIALGIAAGCVVGRYHYILDVAAALLWSLAIFGIVFL